jgi:tryptophan synthase beta subunit
LLAVKWVSRASSRKPARGSMALRDTVGAYLGLLCTVYVGTEDASAVAQRRADAHAWKHRRGIGKTRRTPSTKRCAISHNARLALLSRLSPGAHPYPTMVRDAGT